MSGSTGTSNEEAGFRHRRKNPDGRRPIDASRWRPRETTRGPSHGSNGVMMAFVSRGDESFLEGRWMRGICMQCDANCGHAPLYPRRPVRRSDSAPAGSPMSALACSATTAVVSRTNRQIRLHPFGVEPVITERQVWVARIWPERPSEGSGVVGHVGQTGSTCNIPLFSTLM
jgi:hypothetical protein